MGARSRAGLGSGQKSPCKDVLLNASQEKAPKLPSLDIPLLILIRVLYTVIFPKRFLKPSLNALSSVVSQAAQIADVQSKSVNYHPV